MRRPHGAIVKVQRTCNANWCWRSRKESTPTNKGHASSSSNNNNGQWPNGNVTDNGDDDAKNRKKPWNKKFMRVHFQQDTPNDTNTKANANVSTRKQVNLCKVNATTNMKGRRTSRVAKTQATAMCNESLANECNQRYWRQKKAAPWVKNTQTFAKILVAQSDEVSITPGNGNPFSEQFI